MANNLGDSSSWGMVNDSRVPSTINLGDCIQFRGFIKLRDDNYGKRFTGVLSTIKFGMVPKQFRVLIKFGDG